MEKEPLSVSTAKFPGDLFFDGIKVLLNYKKGSSSMTPEYYCCYPMVGIVSSDSHHVISGSKTKDGGKKMINYASKQQPTNRSHPFLTFITTRLTLYSL